MTRRWRSTSPSSGRPVARLARLFRPGIKARSLTLFAGYVLVLVAVYGGFTIYLLRREVAATHDRLHQTARLVAAEIDAQLEAGKAKLATVARLPGLVYGLATLEQAAPGAHIAPWTTLHYLFFKTRIFTGGVFLLDARGTVLWTEPPGLSWLGMSLADHPAVVAAQRGSEAPVSGALGPDGLLATPHVVVAFPVVDSQGEIAGVLGGVIDLTGAGFTDVLRVGSSGEGRFVLVVDQHGRIVSSTNPAELLAPARPEAWGAGEDPSAAVGLAEATWQVVAGEPREIALGPLHHLQRVLVLLGLGTVLVAVAMGAPFVRGFVTAIMRLTAHAELMAAGDLSRPVPVEPRRDEIETLARTFERMRAELARSQAALRQRIEEREELIRLKEEFLANVSHELRTPLHVIFGYTDMLFDDEPSAERQDLLGRVRSQSQQMMSLVGDLMTLSGLNTGNIALELSPVAVGEVLARLEPLVDQLRQGKSVAIEYDCPAAAQILHTDPLRLDQILANLVTNAFKFTREGKVTVRVRQDIARGRIVFEVADTGIGIPADEIPHIFDEFRQIDGSMSRRHAGMGLGLALVRRLTELLGGEIEVTSRVGEGSSFRVSLPVDTPRVSPPRQARSAQRGRRGAAHPDA